MKDQILRYVLNQITPIPDLEWNFFTQKLEWRTLEKNEMLLHNHESCQHIYFCSSGLLRMCYITEDGEEFNKSFITSNNFFTSYSSMILGLPSFFSIQAMEPTEIAFFSKKTLDQLFLRHCCWETLGRKLVENLYVKKELKERQLLIHSAKERYRIFLKEFPDLESRISQYQIASYLGISPVSLSRIRKEMKL